MGDWDAPSHDGNDEDDQDEYEDGGRDRLLGFMFGNVDGSGDLDVDYLDKDAKEHLAALANQLGPSLADIDLTKSPSTSTAAFEHDYDEKAEDAVDYEDIDEQYEGPEVQVATEEDHLLSKEKYLSSDASFALSNNKTSVFDEENYDEENYDEDEEAQKEIEVETINSEVQVLSPTAEKVELSTKKGDSLDEAIFSTETSEPRNILEESENEEYIQNEHGSSLPILCIEDGMTILRFSEIFGVHEPLKKRVRRDDHRFSIIKGKPSSRIEDTMKELL